MLLGFASQNNSFCMAKVLGESGRYTSQETVNQRRRIIILVCVIIGLLGTIEGLVLSSFIPFSLLPWWFRSVFLYFSISSRTLRDASLRSVVSSDTHLVLPCNLKTA